MYRHERREDPVWLEHLYDELTRINNRLSRIEGGLSLTAFAIVVGIAAHAAGLW